MAAAKGVCFSRCEDHQRACGNTVRLAFLQVMCRFDILSDI